MKTLPLLLLLLCSAATPAASFAASVATPHDPSVVGQLPGEPSVILQWNAALCAWFEDYPDHASPHAQARMFALMHLAMREAVTAVGASHDHAEKQAQASLAAWAAAREIVESAAMLDPKMLAAHQKRHHAAVGNDADAARALDFGRKSAAAVLQRRRTDGWPALLAGEQSLALAAADLLRGGVATHTRSSQDSVWTKLAPFGLKKVQQFEPEPPYFRHGDRLTLPNSRLQKRNRIGTPGELSTALPAFQAWRTFSIVRWNRAARSLAAHHPPAPGQQARVFALLNAALADALLAGSYWCDAYLTGRANPPFMTIEERESFDRAFEEGQLPTPPDMFVRPGRPVSGFPAILAVLAGAAESILGANYGGGEAVLVIDPREGPTTLHSAARECAWAMASNGTSGTDGCISGYDFGFRIGEYIRKQAPR